MVGAVYRELPEPKTVLDIFPIASYDHSSKMISFGKNPRFRPMSGAGDLTNTLTNIRISAGGHSGHGSDLYPRKLGPKVPEST